MLEIWFFCIQSFKTMLQFLCSWYRGKDSLFRSWLNKQWPEKFCLFVFQAAKMFSSNVRNFFKIMIKIHRKHDIKNSRQELEITRIIFRENFRYCNRAPYSGFIFEFCYSDVLPNQFPSWRHYLVSNSAIVLNWSH